MVDTHLVARIPRSLLAQFPPELARVHYSYTSSKQACHQTLDMTKTACAHVASHATLDALSLQIRIAAPN